MCSDSGREQLIVPIATILHFTPNEVMTRVQRKKRVKNYCRKKQKNHEINNVLLKTTKSTLDTHWQFIDERGVALITSVRVLQHYAWRI